MNGVQEGFSRRGDSLWEGDLVTGISDIANDRTYMIAPNRKRGGAGGNGAMVKYLLSLEIIPREYRDGWNLEHPSNTTWLSGHVCIHHNSFATILIAPSIHDSKSVALRLSGDNSRRSQHVLKYGTDPGRSEEMDWFQDTVDRYELVVLSPHFLTGGSALVVKHPSTGRFTNFYYSEDGFLHEGSPAGPRLPPFSSRGGVDRNIPLNPILVNFAAHIRTRRLDRRSREWRKHLHPEAQEIIGAVEDLHAAVVWEPEQPKPPHFVAQKRDLPTMRQVDTEELMHTDFVDLPDLAGDRDPSPRPELDPALGVMTDQEKMERFLAIH